MKFIQGFVLTLSLLTGLHSFAEIKEVRSMREVAENIKPGDVIVFDLDNTVFQATQTLGTDQFFSYLVEKAKAQGANEVQAKAWALQQSGIIQPVTEVTAVEVNTPYFINALQTKQFITFALTARPPVWRTGTLRQVKSLGVDFKRTAPRLSAYETNRLQLSQYAEGVLFLPPGTEKGAAVLEFLRGAGQRPNRVLFVDDKKNNVESVDRALMEARIPVMAFRYGAADTRVQSFDAKIAETELNYFLKTGIFLSDEAARTLAH